MSSFITLYVALYNTDIPNKNNCFVLLKKFVPQLFLNKSFRYSSSSNWHLSPTLNLTGPYVEHKCITVVAKHFSESNMIQY